MGLSYVNSVNRLLLYADKLSPAHPTSKHSSLLFTEAHKIFLKSVAMAIIGEIARGPVFRNWEISTALRLLTRQLCDALLLLSFESALLSWGLEWID